MVDTSPLLGVYTKPLLLVVNCTRGRGRRGQPTLPPALDGLKFSFWLISSWCYLFVLSLFLYPGNLKKQTEKKPMPYERTAHVPTVNARIAPIVLDHVISHETRPLTHPLSVQWRSSQLVMLVQLQGRGRMHPVSEREVFSDVLDCITVYSEWWIRARSSN